MSNVVYENASGILAGKYINENKKELFRKSIHVCAAFVPFFLHLNRPVTLVLLCAVLVLYSLAETLRFRGVHVPLFSSVTDMASRQRDRGHFVLGPVTLALGVLVTAFFFDPVASALGIYALAFGDGIASLVGRAVGHISIPFTGGKTVEGSLACFAAVFLASFIITHNTSIALCIAGAAMLLEVLPLKDFDNLLIPAAIALLSQFIFLL
ncbi:MAG: phosphatidate cytidylyltransferase [Spirochaetaceae bacterium]|jgi:dolichol kinase|nr:phosphatidate cytidylyltransferase [Spirochaetaceae bacterium]